MKYKYRQMSAGELRLSRKKLGLTIPTMAKILCASIDEYKRYERDGLRAPHDIEGPTVRIVQILTFTPRKDVDVTEKQLKILRKYFGYKGPEKKFSGVKLLHK